MSDKALVVGESLVDIVRGGDGSTTEFPGGSAANVAVALARLGRAVSFATSWGDDHRGRVLAERLARDGVELAADPHAVGHTSTAQATIGSDGAASYEFDLAWRLNQVDTTIPPLVVHTCSLGAVIEPGAGDVVALLEELRGTATISYDVNARPAITGTGPALVAQVEAVAALSDVVKASDEDLAALYDDLDTLSGAKRLLALGPAAVVVTRGNGGATWVTIGQEVDVAAVPVVVADTIGAGDTFCAGLLDALWQRDLIGAGRRDALHSATRDTVVSVLAQAARAASVTVSRPGADPPYRHELQ
ncbi:PfkB family carbohydrate kinase [Nocardioides euryhalodurans]|uniref:Carbohydrate kinase n=1 Tax=Nocardioides euryhalodurans TaxID=2518370 RepID=A0A4P7GMZ5_9ACTN|nr:PfkB family carbohydrate kinase [Nocardioides euryhalodurans]QBR93558.1 carbohydrate kinase [Nocardioides euryhalodurans]